MTFFVTFPQKYRTEAHPSGLMAHPNGYWIINATSYQEAENLAFKYFGASTFDEIFGQAEFDASLFPQFRCFGVIYLVLNL